LRKTAALKRKPLPAEPAAATLALEEIPSQAKPDSVAAPTQAYCGAFDLPRRFAWPPRPTPSKPSRKPATLKSKTTANDNASRRATFFQVARRQFIGVPLPKNLKTHNAHSLASGPSQVALARPPELLPRKATVPRPLRVAARPPLLRISKTMPVGPFVVAMSPAPPVGRQTVRECLPAKTARANEHPFVTLLLLRPHSHTPGF
jgi:hypothetical protein